MKIYAIVATRNESDIIESFCRYTLSYCDGIILSPLPGDDNTDEIVQNLIDEGLSIVRHFVFYKRGLIDFAMKETDAQLLLPLDPDEFYCTKNGGNPRAVFERLDKHKYYEIPWRTYVYNGEPETGVFMPRNFGEYRDPALEKFGKVAVCRGIYESYHPDVAPGFHSLVFPEGSDIQAETPDDLVLGHFPVRSRTQVLMKAISGRILNVLQSHDLAFQYDHIYDSIKETGDVTGELMRKISLEYALMKDEISGNITTINGELDTSGCLSDLTLKYTAAYENPHGLILKSVLNEFDKAFSGYLSDVHNGRVDVGVMVGGYRDKTIQDHEKTRHAADTCPIEKPRVDRTALTMTPEMKYDLPMSC